MNIFLVLTLAIIAQSFPTNEVEDSTTIIIKENTLENSKTKLKCNLFYFKSNNFSKRRTLEELG